MIGRVQRRLGGRPPDSGSAVVEFVFGAVLVFVPLVYLVVAVASLQRTNLAVTNAARDVGRAVATSASGPDADRRAQAALRIALGNQGMDGGDVELRFTAAGSGCDTGAVAPSLTPGSSFAVCIIRHVRLPAVPSILSGKGITSVGRFVVHVDEFRVGSS